ncbi:hypothetical protein L1S32_06020 [Methanogenium sp. S4BF]|uniref:hypothetical protein n=1 Tax=Methanogenium sp. S4BF TaxID=1789226 RepID=UPI00241664B7|nr:hypothetical protein [Methanogenium sp. S4BF]WFN35652.1 hypothetical protein L1S32_06020 [Methanogenium sp. S4BF]
MKNIPPDHAPAGPVVPSAFRMLAENGVDTTELEAAFENGDITGIHAFFQKIRPTGAVPGRYHGDASPGPAFPDSFGE